MGHHVSHQAMTKLSATVVVLLLALGAPAISAGRIFHENLGSMTSGRGLMESTRRTLTSTMMHAQHIDSPYRRPNMTELERAEDATRSSKQRLSYFSSRISGSQKTATTAAASDVYTSPVTSSQTYYVTPFDVGTPARTFYFFVDTGSDLIWLQCAPCDSCYTEPEVLYDPSQSTSYTNMACAADLCAALASPKCSTTEVCLYDYSYGDQSYTEGNMGYETFTFTDTDGTAAPFSEVAFGCGTNQSGGVSGTFDGLVGLGGGPLSLVSQAGTYFNSEFAYCLTGYSAALTTTSPLLLGGLGDAVYIYTPLVVNNVIPTFYYVNLLGIAVDGTPVDYPAGTFDISTIGDGGIILDSGTTITQLFDAAYTPLIAAVSALITYPTVDGTQAGFDLCYDTSSVASPVFPSITFSFENLDLNLNVPNTFLDYEGQGVYCLFIQNTGTNTGVSIFGNIQQSNFAIGYDILNGQVGFAAQYC